MLSHISDRSSVSEELSLMCVRLWDQCEPNDCGGFSCAAGEINVL